MFLPLLVLLSFSTFAKEISMSTSLENADLNNTSIPVCKVEDLEVKPLCRSLDSSGYLTLWKVVNKKSYRCVAIGSFSTSIEDKYFPEEWNSGPSQVCGAYWNGNGKLSLKVGEQKGDLTLKSISSCSVEQIKSIHELCNLAPLPRALEFFTAQLDKETMCISLNFKSNHHKDLIRTTIQRSYDGKSFEDLDIVSGDSYLDCSGNKKGNLFYRIKNQNHKGVERIYSSLNLRLKESTTAALFVEDSIFTDLKVELHNKEMTPIEVMIFDEKGKNLETKKIFLDSHDSVLKYNVSRYPAGSYIVKLKNQDKNAVQVGKFRKK